MSVAKVRGGRRLDASYETEADDSQTSNGRGRMRRNLSFRGNSSVDHASHDDYKPLADDTDGDVEPVSTNMSLDRRDRGRNPIQKAVDGMRSMFKNLSTSSPSLQHRRRSPVRADPVPATSAVSTIRRNRANSLSHAPLDFTDRSPPAKQPKIPVLPRGRQPGAFGIHNHGNTCFMNAVLQCLSNTDLLSEYLLSDELRTMLAGSGQKCTLTKQLVALVEGLWTGSYHPEVSSRFKEIVGECAEQYSGTAQNDAQEFLLWLLDKVNEELCSLEDREFTTNGSRRQTTNNNNISNSRLIFDLFQAKYRSTLTCPTCHQQSHTYDPFLSVSLPIQQKHRVPVYVTVAYQKPYYHQVRFGLMMTSGDTVGQLRKRLVRETGIEEKQLLLTQIFNGSFQSTLDDSEPLVDLDTLDFIYAVEMYNDPVTNGNPANDNYPNTEMIRIVAVNRVADGPRRSSRFGGPFIVKVSRDSTILELRKALLSGMQSMVPPGMMEKVVTESRFSMRLVSDVANDVFLRDTDDMPLYAVAVDEVLSLCSDSLCQPHIKLVLEWRYLSYKRMLIDTHPAVICHSSFRQVKDAMRHTDTVDLQDCFSAFTQQEQLGDEDTWYCPNCHKSQSGTIKSLNLSSLPDVMIVHLKRFKQEGDNRSKLNTMIKFPLSGLDMSYHLTKGLTSNNNEHVAIKNDDYIYDLYGVCNHDGSMSQGHYRAVCKNPLNGQWYLYDDAKVTEIREDRVVTRAAYLLFYKRRQAPSRCDNQLERCIARLLSGEPLDSPVNHIRDMEPPRKPVVPKADLSNRSFDTRPVQAKHSWQLTSNSNATLQRPLVLPATKPPTLNNSFHASLRKPVRRKIPASHSAMDAALAISTPVMGHAAVSKSKSNPQPNSSLPVNSSKFMNGTMEKSQTDFVDLSCTSDVSMLSASAVLDVISKTSNSTKPKLIFQKAPSFRPKESSEKDDLKQETRLSGPWQHKAAKYVQESSV